MPTIIDALFEQSLRCLRAHYHPEHGDRTPLDVFNRLLAKNIRPDGWTANTHFDIQPQQVSSRREHWRTVNFATLNLGHDATEGGDFDCPIVIAEYQGRQRLLDGNHRINRWIQARDPRSHDVNIHTITGDGRLVQLPPIKPGN